MLKRPSAMLHRFSRTALTGLLGLGAWTVAPSAQAQTVEQAVGSGCSTTSVKALSLQIIAQAQCIEPNAFTEIPAQNNVQLGAAVFPFLEAPARDALIAAVQSKPGTTLVVNSMLRTVAQQYLLYRWYQNGTCGIGLAATPGNSNHETGLALDISSYSTWRPTLEANGFNWYGPGDSVHFTYVGAGAIDYRGLDVQAFQELWNLNHPEDPIVADGEWGTETQSRMQASPAAGFPIGATCAPVSPTSAKLRLWVEFEAIKNVYQDGASADIVDAWPGDRFQAVVYVTNEGELAASRVELGLALPSTHVLTDEYQIESNWNAPDFVVNDANDHGDNPKHETKLNGETVFVMNALSPGETKRVVLDAEALEPSVWEDPGPSFDAWIRSIDDIYQQDGFGDAPDDPNDTQTFNGGVLEARGGLDIYDPQRWLWDTDRLEGWTADGGEVSVDDGALEVAAGGKSDELGAQSPELELASVDNPALYVAIGWKTGGGDVLVSYETDKGGTDTIRVLVQASGDNVEVVVVPLEGRSAYAGTLNRLWIAPADEGTLRVEAVSFTSLDDLDFGPGTQGFGVEEDEDPETDSGCGCRAVGGATTGWGAGVIGVGLLLASFFGRRRRRR